MKKSKMDKKVYLIILTIAFVLFAYCIYTISPFLGSDGIFMPSVSKIEKFLDSNISELTYVSEYMCDLNCDYARWDVTSPSQLTCYYYKEFIGNTRQTISDVEDRMLFENINKLHDAKVEHIIKENNYIEFVKWSSLDSSCGLLYCQSDNPNIIDYGKTDIQRLSVVGWYYYIHKSE